MKFYWSSGFNRVRAIERLAHDVNRPARVRRRLVRPGIGPDIRLVRRRRRPRRASPDMFALLACLFLAGWFAYFLILALAAR